MGVGGISGSKMELWFVSDVFWSHPGILLPGLFQSSLEAQGKQFAEGTIYKSLSKFNGMVGNLGLTQKMHAPPEKHIDSEEERKLSLANFVGVVAATDSVCS